MTTTVTRYDQNGNETSSQPLSQVLKVVDGSEQNSADLPSYTSTAYDKVLPHIVTCMDAYEGSTAWVVNGEITDDEKAVRYLPKESQEQPNQYASRVIRSLFKNAFKSAVKGFAGLLSDSQLSEDAAIAEHIDDVDRQGSSLAAFLCDADELVLRDGMCGILVDYPQRPDIQDAAQEQALDLRPYLVLIERKDVLNWKYDSDGMLSRVTIRMVEAREDGAFGEKMVTTYHVWYPGIKQVWEEQETDDTVTVVLISEVAISIPQIPFVAHSITSLRPFDSMPPLLSLALMNFHHYRLYSDYMEVMHKCNLPVPVREGAMLPGTTDSSELPPVVIGPNTAIDIPTGGSFYFAEPSGAAIGATRQAIIDLEESMMQESLNFLGNAGQRTKYEAQLRSSQSRASLSLLAEQKESSVQAVFELWALWEGSDNPGKITISRDLLTEKLEPTMVSILSEMQTLGQLPLSLMLQSLKEGRILPQDTDVEAIAERVAPPQNEALGL